MRLRRLHITTFGHLHDYTIEFRDGVTVLLGPNEAGKSTVLFCIAQVLYGKPSQRSLFPDFAPWAGGEFAAELEIEREGIRYRLLRRFAESGPRAVALSELRADGSERLITREAAEVRNWLAEALGTADDRIFYRVFCLTQADLNPLDNFGGLREQLERVAGGAEVAVTAATGRVDARLALLRRGVGQPALPQNWGAMKRAAEAAQEWDTRLLDARRQQRKLTELRERMQVVQESLQHGTARVDEITGLLEGDRNRRELTTRLDGLNAEWERLQETHDRTTGIEEERGRLQERFAGLPVIYENIEAARTRLIAADSRGHRLVRLGWLLIAFGALAVLGALIKKTSVFFVGSMLTFEIPFGLLWLYQYLRVKAAQARLLNEFGVSNRDEALKRLEEVENDKRSWAATQQVWDAFSGTSADPTRRRELVREIAVMEERIARLPGPALTAEASHRLSMEQQSLHDALPGQQQEERALLRELAVLEEAERDLIDLEDGVAYWREEEARAREEEQALLLARELLVQAGEQAHGAMTAPLAEAITPLFATMTGGRYPAVRVTGDADAFAIHPLDAAGTPIPPDQLSRGTRDQFILAVRLALGQVIAAPGGSPLFLLDDPLLHFDADRRHEALAVLTQWAARDQIILATHDESILADLPAAAVVRLS